MGDKICFLLLGDKRVFNIGFKSVLRLGAKRVCLGWVPKESFIVGCQKNVLRSGAKRVLVLSVAIGEW